MRTRHLAAVLAAVAASAVAAAPSAVAGGPGGAPAISQYVETVPTGAGGRAPGTGANAIRSLPSGLTAKLGGAGTDAPLLRALVTNSALGAPARRIPLPPSATESQLDRSAFTGALSAVGGASKWTLIPLLLAMLATTAAAGGAAARRTRALAGGDPRFGRP